MAAKQIRWLARLLPDDWELIFVDDGSNPPIPIPDERPANFQLLRTRVIRDMGEWTQHLAINRAVQMVARGSRIIKSDIDHVFTREAIEAADCFDGDMMLFNRRAGVLTDDFRIEPIDHPVHSPVDDIYVMRTDLFLRLGGYPKDVTRQYGGAGKCFWEYSRKAEAQPPDKALIFVTPDTHETYHGLARAQ